jgi:hypothetical protein
LTETDILLIKFRQNISEIFNMKKVRQKVRKRLERLDKNVKHFSKKVRQLDKGSKCECRTSKSLIINNYIYKLDSYISLYIPKIGKNRFFLVCRGL